MQFIRSIVFSLLAFGFVGCFAADHAPNHAPNPAIASTHLPLFFEENRGQASPDTQFLSHGPGYLLDLRSQGAVVQLQGNEKASAASVQFTLHDSNPDSKGRGEGRQSGQSNYLRGNDSTRWITGVANFSAVRFPEVYPGIDVVYYGNGRQIEHDFIVAAGADPKRIALDVDGAKKLQVADSGDLAIETDLGSLMLKRPVAYQETSTGRRNVEAAYALHESKITFTLGNYDHALPLIIDPILVYSTYFSGNNFETVTGVASDALGNVYVTGTTASTNLPMVSAFQTTCNGCASAQSDIFVFKLDSTGANLLYSTYIGGAGTDNSVGIGFDGNGNALIAGTTTSSDFPLKNSIVNPGTITGQFGFVLSLASSGASLNYSSLIAGVSSSFAMAVDSAGSTYFAGTTQDPNWPITSGTIATSVPASGNPVLCVAKFNAAGVLQYSTVIPGTATYQSPFNQNVFIPLAVTTDSGGSLYIGGTASPGLPVTPGVVGSSFPGDPAITSVTYGFVLKANPTASVLSYATYIPGTTKVSALTNDTGGAIFIAGDAQPSFPVTPGAFQTSYPDRLNCGCGINFIARLKADASAYSSASFLGDIFSGPSPTAGASINSIVRDVDGFVVASGITSSANFPLRNPIVGTFDGRMSGFVTKMKPDLSDITSSTFLNGLDVRLQFQTAHMVNVLLAPSSSGKVFVAGATYDRDFPTTPGSFKPALLPADSPSYAFVARLDFAVTGPAACVDNSALDFGGVDVNVGKTLNVALSNCGNANMHFASVAFDGPNFSQTNSCSGTIAPGQSCQITITFTPADTNPQSRVMTVNTDAVAPAKVLLTGKGGHPIVIIPNSFNVGSQLVGTTSVSAHFTLMNLGDAPYVATSVVASGDFAVISNQCLTPIEPSFTCEILITVTPSVAGTVSGLLALQDNFVSTPYTVSLLGTGINSYPAPTITAITAVESLPTGAVANVTGTNFFAATTGQWNGAPRPTSVLDSKHLTLQLTAADVSSLGEVAVTVSTPAPGGGTSAFFKATIYQTLNIWTNDILYEPISQLAYASVSPLSSLYPNTVIALDPATGSVKKVFSVGTNPDRLAVSDDGSLLYVGVDGSHSVAQISLRSGTLNFLLPLGSDPTFGAYVAEDIKVLPGSPHSYAVSLGISPGNSFLSLAIYDDQTARPNRVSSSSGVLATSLAFLGDPSTIFGTGGSSLYRFSIDAAGVALASSTSNLGGSNLTTDGQWLYLSNGNVIDPAGPTLLRTLTVPQTTLIAICPEKTLPRIYASVNTSFNGRLVVSDKQTLAQLGSLSFPTNIYFYQSPPLRWGTNGFLQRTNQFGALQLVSFRSSLSGESAALVQPLRPGRGTRKSGSVVTFADDVPAVDPLTVTNVSAPSAEVHPVTHTAPERTLRAILLPPVPLNRLVFPIFPWAIPIYTGPSNDPTVNPAKKHRATCTAKAGKKPIRCGKLKKKKEAQSS